MIQVVAGVIVRGDRVLCARKGQTGNHHTAFKFEFPGGKIDEGELPEIALKRELHEELGIDVHIMRSLGNYVHAYPDPKVDLHFFLCEIEQKEPVALEHIELCWKTVDEVTSLDWAGADLPMVQRLIKEGLHALFS